MSTQFQPYLESIRATYAQWWQLYTLTDAAGKQKQTEAAAPIFDFGLMVQTIIPQKDTLAIGANGIRPDRETKIERFNVLEGLRKYAAPDQKPPHVLLVGRPGSGKSTALARLMLEEAEMALTPSPSPKAGRGEPEDRRIPVLVELCYWQGSIAQLILNAFSRHGLPLTPEQLEPVSAQALLLFDGVNELPSDVARSQLAAFRHDHPQVPMIFTTRDLSLGGDLGIEQKLEMQPLTEPQMQAFVRAYVPEQAEALLRQLKDRLRELGQTPLLLWMLCEVIQQTPDYQLPSNLAGVFQIFTTGYEQSSVRKHEVALLKGDVRPLSDRRLWKQALKGLALTMIQGKTPVDPLVVIPRNEALNELSKIFPNEQFPVRDILDDLLKYHLLQNRTTDQIEFRHQLIQEYYAAEALLEQLPDLSDGELQREYLNYLKWTEPVALMLALVPSEAQALRVVRLALAVDWMLGARLAGEVKREFQAQTVRLVDELDVPDWLKVKLLGETRSDCALASLLQLVEGADPAVRWRTAYALGRIGSTMAISSLLKLAEDADYFVRRNAAAALGELGNATVIPGFDYFVRKSTAQAGKIVSATVIPGFLQLLEDADSAVRGSAAYALGKIGSEMAIPGLLQLMKDAEFTVSGSAAESLGQIGSATVIPHLLELLKDPNSAFGGGASYALGQIGNATVIPHLLKLLEDPDSAVRRGIAYALGQIESATAIPHLLKLLADSDLEVSDRAVEALNKIAKKHANTLAPHLLTLIPTDSGQAAHRVILAIQANCKYYNYAIFCSPPAQPQPPLAPGTTIHIAGDYIATGDKVGRDKIGGDKTENSFPNVTAVKIFENVQTYHEAPPSDPPP